MNLWFFCGLPGSGKTTYRQNLINIMNESFCVLSTDDYIEENKRISYNESFTRLIKEAEKNMYAELKNAIENKKSIIWDQTNISKKSRVRKLQKIPNSYKKILVYFPASMDCLFMVNNERKKIDRQLDEDMIISMYKSLEEPDMKEGFDEMIII